MNIETRVCSDAGYWT